MIIENVNGEAKRVFYFGDNNEIKCYAPSRIGAGYRKRIEIAKASGAVSDGTMAKVVEALGTRKRPNGLPDKQWRQQLQDEAMELLTAEVTANVTSGNLNQDLPVLQVLLTPAEGTLSVETIYNEYATAEQVQDVLNFSEGLAESRTESDPLPKPSGKGSKTVAKAVRSRSTSRRRSGA